MQNETPEKFIEFEATVRKLDSKLLGTFGKITSKKLSDFIGRKVSITVIALE